jgi:hypothetical protein
MLFDFQRHGGDPVVDRWVDNVFIQDLTARARPPRARFVRRKPVTLRAMHVHPRTELLPRCVEPSDKYDDAALWLMLHAKAYPLLASA